MRTTVWFASIVAAALIATTALAQQSPAPPDVSGTWVLDPSQTRVVSAFSRAGMAPAAGVAPIGEPRKVKDVRPTYPASAISAKLNGRVILESVIDGNGEVADLRVLRSMPTFDEAALEAVAKWRYSPTLLNNEPVEVLMTVVVTFTIGGPMAPDGTLPVRMGVPTFGSGLGQGLVATRLRINQDPKKLVVEREIATGPDKVTYALDGKPSKNRLPKAGLAIDDTYTYTSRSEAGALVTTIVWKGPNGLREVTETLVVEADTLRVTLTRRDPATATDKFVQTTVYMRQK